jgi:NAD(P)-dependent dehydrogenase (short-subunit alcohol dehydrogenase family)
MNPVLKELAGLVRAPVRAATHAANRPIGINVIDRLRHLKTLEEAVSGQVVLITGASSGIGAAAAERIGAAGGQVVLVARGREKLEETAALVQEAGGAAYVHPCNLTDMDAIDAMVADVIDEHGRVDILVNNAGRSIRRSIELSYERFHDFERTMQLNYFAAVRLILRTLPGMRERGSGHIINISSVGVQTRVPRFAAYIASKAALDTFSDAVQGEVLDDGVRFTTIHMPLVRTPMIAPTKMYDRFPTLTPEQAADLVARAIIFRPRRLGAPFGHAAALADAVTPEAMDVVRNRGYKMFPDTRAARGDVTDGKPDEPATTAASEAFARVTRGVHW